jgi:hypothetical protein
MIWLVGLFLLASTFSATEGKPHLMGGDSGNAPAQAQQPLGPISVPNQARAAPAAPQGDQLDRHGAERQLWVEEGQFWASAGQVVVGGLGLIGLFFTVMYARAAWKAAAASAKSADDTYRAMLASEQREMRAYVGLFKISVEGTETGVPKITLVFQNAGQTPAQDVGALINFRFDAFPPTMPETNLDDEQYLSVAYILPGSQFTRTTTFPKPIPADELVLLSKGKAAIWCNGRIRYKDVFGVLHFTHFKLMMGGDIGGYPDALMMCREGNYAT